MKNYKLKIIFILFINFFGVLFFAKVSLAATYYVSTTGNDSNPGTEASPWLTITKAAQTMVAGDTTYIKSGAYTPPCNGTWYIPDINPSNSGTLGAPITFAVYPGHTVTITPSAARKTTNGSLVGAMGKDYIIWDGAGGSFIVDTSTMTATHGGAMIMAASHCELRNMTFIGHYVNTGDNNDLIRIQEGHNTRVYNCKIYGQLGQDEDTAGIKLYYTQDVIIEHNEIYNCSCGINDKDSGTRNIHRYNIIYDIGVHGIYGPGNATTCTWEVYQNILYNIGDAAIHLNYTHYGTRVWNNTIYNAGRGIVVLGNAGGHSEIFNNIFRNVTGYGIYIRNSNVSYSNYNDWFSPPNFFIDSSTMNYSSWKSTTGFDANSITSDPLFVNPSGDFHLQSSSPARNSGRNGVTMGAYIIGNEIIGYTVSGGDTTPPAAPAGVKVQ